jgi:hypothetical protein
MADKIDWMFADPHPSFKIPDSGRNSLFEVGSL